tara:strand:+ start:626 stop:958 length:333 start_codon:yes stop_codon:yes gene_type:complete
MSINNNNDININLNLNFILGLLGNSLNLLYNIPFVYQVYKNNDTKNISTCFLLLRNLGSISWLSYGILEEDNWIISSYSVTLTSSLIISYYKLKDKLKKNNPQNNFQNNP